MKTGMLVAEATSIEAGGPPTLLYISTATAPASARLLTLSSKVQSPREISPI